MNILLESLYSKKGMIAFANSRGIRLTKALGQHFFLQKDWLASIANKAHLPHEGHVIEIGPGLGHLTWILLERGLHVTAVEKDRRFASMLAELSEIEPDYAGRLEIVEADALKTDFVELQRRTGATCVTGNLPYNVSVPILFHLAYSGAPFDQLCFMMQKEVGERILSESGCKAYGRLSIVLQYLFDIEPVETLPPHVFFPPPKVESMVMTFLPKPGVDIEFAKQFIERVVQLGFLHRRKKLKSSMKGGIVQRRVFDPAFFEQAGGLFDFDERAEQWPLSRWIEFADYVRSLPAASKSD